jgi:hypothetical protein
MNLWLRFRRLTLWNKLFVVGSLCSILAFVGWLVFGGGENSVDVNVEDSPDAKVQSAVKSPGATQVMIENLTVNLSAQLERKLTLSPVYVNKPQGDKYVTLLRGRLKAPYPVPNLRVEAHGNTVEEINFTGTRLYVLSDRGKHEGYVFATWQDAIGNLELNIVSRQAGKLHISFAVQE